MRSALLDNLISNAIKYNKTKGTLTVILRQEYISLSKIQVFGLKKRIWV